MLPIFTLGNVSGFLTLETFGEKIIQISNSLYNWWYAIDPNKISNDEFKKLVLDNENKIKEMQEKILENEKIIFHNIKNYQNEE